MRCWRHADRQVEPKGLVGGEALGVHSGEHRDVFVDVVVELDVLFVAVGPEKPADVLDHPTLEGDGERATWSHVDAPGGRSPGHRPAIGPAL